MQKSFTGAVIRNDRGELLPYSCQSTISQVEEWAVQFFGPEIWEKLKKRGETIVSFEAKVAE